MSHQGGMGGARRAWARRARDSEGASAAGASAGEAGAAGAGAGRVLRRGEAGRTPYFSCLNCLLHEDTCFHHVRRCERLW